MRRSLFRRGLGLGLGSSARMGVGGSGGAWAAASPSSSASASRSLGRFSATRLLLACAVLVFAAWTVAVAVVVRRQQLQQQELEEGGRWPSAVAWLADAVVPRWSTTTTTTTNAAETMIGARVEPLERRQHATASTTTTTTTTAADIPTPSPSHPTFSPTKRVPTPPPNQLVANESLNVLPDLPDRADEKHMREMDMDPLKEYRPVDLARLREIESIGFPHVTPLNAYCGKNATWLLPDQGHKFGGFTADIGFVMMVAMYAFETKQCVDFQPAWGHGCGSDMEPQNWLCFFRPIQNYPVAHIPRKQTIVIHSDSFRLRTMVRRDDTYLPTWKGHRYPRLEELMPNAIGPTSDLLAWRLVFRWTFRVRDDVAARVLDIKRKVFEGLLGTGEEYSPPRYAAAHIRMGDKLGLKAGPKEAKKGTYCVKDFWKKLELYYSKVVREPFPEVLFVATDDYRAVSELLRLVPSTVRIVTTSVPHRDRGFSIVDYRGAMSSAERFDAAVRMWADLELLAEADAWVGSFQSNVARIVQVMRLTKLANSTLAVDRFSTSRCTFENRHSGNRNNAWVCP